MKSLMKSFQELYFLLGDGLMLKLLLKHHVYECLGGARWLQLAGRAPPAAVPPREEPASWGRTAIPRPNLGHQV